MPSVLSQWLKGPFPSFFPLSLLPIHFPLSRNTPIQPSKSRGKGTFFVNLSPVPQNKVLYILFTSAACSCLCYIYSSVLQCICVLVCLSYFDYEFFQGGGRRAGGCVWFISDFQALTKSKYSDVSGMDKVAVRAFRYTIRTLWECHLLWRKCSWRFLG